MNNKQQNFVDTSASTYTMAVVPVDSNGADTSRNSFVNVSTSTTTLVKTGAGALHAITVNTKGTVASTVTVYDSLTATGTKIATIDSLNLSGSFTFDLAFSTGLTVVTTGTVAPDITVTYR